MDSPKVTARLCAVTSPWFSAGQAQGAWRLLSQGLLELKQARPTSDNLPDHEAGGWRPQLVVGPHHGGLLQKLEAGFKRHLLQRGGVGPDPKAVQWLVNTLEAHIVSDQGEVAGVHGDTVHGEHVLDLLSITRSAASMPYVLAIAWMSLE